jgi:DNA-binding NtrC family response regulator
MTTVLYVDDESPLRRAVHAWLGRHGTSVHSARTVEGAKRCLEEFAVDGVFIDLWLADGSGFELFDWLSEHHPDVARNVAFVTGDILRTAATQRQLGLLDRPLLTKPFDLTELDRLVELWTRGDSERASTARQPLGAGTVRPTHALDTPRTDLGDWRGIAYWDQRAGT